MPKPVPDPPRIAGIMALVDEYASAHTEFHQPWPVSSAEITALRKKMQARREDVKKALVALVKEELCPVPIATAGEP